MSIIDAPRNHAPGAEVGSRLTWLATLVCHLGPAAGAFVVALALAPLAQRLGLPADFSLTVAFAVVLTPVELGVLVWAAHRATGLWSLRAIGAVVAYRRPLRWWWLSVPVL